LPKLNIPAMALYHDCIILDKAQSANDDWLEEQAIGEIRRVASNVDKMIVTSQYTRSRLAGILEYEQHGKLCVIPHMASNESHPSRKAVEPLPYLPANYLYYSANLSPHKGHDKLLRAFSRIMQSEDFIPLVFTGYETDVLQDLEKCASHENHYINELANIISNSGMVHGKHYYSLGYLADNEIQAVFRFCSALVTVSNAEGMGLPVHEAIELGKPILLSDIEVFREHYSGRIGLPFWVNPLSETSIYKGLCDLCYALNNYPGRYRPSKPTPHTWDDIAKCTAIHIQECLGLA
jgi:glycosyltransferase involved in cell wall biosynthesis